MIATLEPSWTFSQKALVDFEVCLRSLSSPSSQIKASLRPTLNCNSIYRNIGCLCYLLVSFSLFVTSSLKFLDNSLDLPMFPICNQMSLPVQVISGSPDATNEVLD